MPADPSARTVVRQNAVIHPDWDAETHQQYLAAECMLPVTRAAVERWLAEPSLARAKALAAAELEEARPRPPVLGTALLDSGDLIDRLGDGSWWNVTEQRPATADETTEGIELLLGPDEEARG
jgi:hypothetical protein